MTMQTKGTRLFFATPEAPDMGSSETLVILQMLCPTAIQGLDAAQPQTQELDTAYPSKAIGGELPDEIVVPFNFHDQSRAHQALVMMRDAKVQCSFMLAFGRDTPAPTTTDADGRLVSAGATSAEWVGKVLAVSHDIQVGDVVRSTLRLVRESSTAWDFPAWSV